MDGIDGPPRYQPKNILITGGAGFIGSHVALLLVKKYPRYRIVVLDKLDYCAALDNLKEIQPLRNFKFVKGDICSSDLVEYLLEEEEIDTIMHFAAQTHVDNSFGNSFSFTQNNILGTHVLLESAKAHGIKRFIHVSTDEVYGEGAADQEPMFEDQVLEPTNPYAATKAGAEFIAKSYSRSFNLPLIITRGNNVYGPHQYPEKLIPKCISLLMRGRPVTLHGNGLNTRNYLHVRDVASAFDLILHQGVTGRIYNIGGSNEKANIEVARDIIRTMGLVEPLPPPQQPDGNGGAEEEGEGAGATTEEAGSSGEEAAGAEQAAMDRYITHVEDRFFNDLRYTVNCSSLKALGWREQISWADGLRETIDWYRNPEHTARWGNIEGALVAHPSHPL